LLVAAVAFPVPAFAQTPAHAAAAQAVDLLQGAAWHYSTDGGKSYSSQPPLVPSGKTMQVTVKAEFSVARMPNCSLLELRSAQKRPWDASFAMNGQEIAPPLKGMIYRTLPAVDARLLKQGANVVTALVKADNSGRTGQPPPPDEQFEFSATLIPVDVRNLRIQSGPILGAFGQDYFTVTCRTNMPARVSVCVVQVSSGSNQQANVSELAASETGLIHRLRIDNPPTTVRAHTGFVVFAQVGDFHVSERIDPPVWPADGKLRFAALGDNRTNAKAWGTVAGAVLKAQPQLLLHTGDLVVSGRADWLWDEDLLAPAKELFARVPVYPVIGNHEGNAPLYDEIFYMSSRDGRGRNWAQTVADVLFIGIDGKQDWAAGSPNVQWLEKVLQDAKHAKFIFLVNHYPSWSSAKHGETKSGKPVEMPVRQAQEVIMPLLEKHKATAFVAGHDHCYERSEPPGGVSVIVSGGGGAGVYLKTATAAQQNPYSKVFAAKHHYCVFDVNGATCTMKALTPEGETLDTRTWQARQVGK